MTVLEYKKKFARDNKKSKTTDLFITVVYGQEYKQTNFRKPMYLKLFRQLKAPDSPL